MSREADPSIYLFYLFVEFKKIGWNTRAFERLVLPRRVKELVKALVTVRTTSTKAVREPRAAGGRDDIVAGKGKGLIMLLHGGPGTGKTLTAGMVLNVTKDFVFIANVFNQRGTVATISTIDSDSCSDLIQRCRDRQNASVPRNVWRRWHQA